MEVLRNPETTHRKNIAKVVLSVAALSFAVSGCESDGADRSTSSGSSGSSERSVSEILRGSDSGEVSVDTMVSPTTTRTELGYDENGCEMTRIVALGGNLTTDWISHLNNGIQHCYSRIGGFLYDVYDSRDIDNPDKKAIFRRDFEDPLYLKTMNYDGENLWTRVLIEDTDVIEAYYQDEWMPIGDYEAARQKSLDEQERDHQDSLRQQANEIEIIIRQGNNDAIGAWTRPPCAYSYRGC